MVTEFFGDDDSIGGTNRPSPSTTGLPPGPIFFAINPDDDAAERIVAVAEQLSGQHGLRGKPIGRERLHMTLLYAGDASLVPASTIARVIDVGSKIDMPSFDMSLVRAMSFTAADEKAKPFVLRTGDKAPGIMLSKERLRWR